MIVMLFSSSTYLFDNVYYIKTRRERALFNRNMPLKIKKQIPGRGNLPVQDAVRKGLISNERADDDLRTSERREAMVAFAHRYSLAGEKTMTEQKEDTRLIGIL